MITLRKLAGKNYTAIHKTAGFRDENRRFCSRAWFRGNRGEIPQIVIFVSVGDGFQIFRTPAVGDADTGDSPLLGHVYCMLSPAMHI